jgi:Kef-type K+ transport system membrane component KefB
VLLFLFLVGLEIDLALLAHRGRTSVAVSHASIVTPFLLGAVLALHLYPRLATSDVPFSVFSLFLGVSLSVTAFPVLARILTDRGLQGSPLGTMALACAAVDDVTAWCLLAFVVGYAGAEPGQALLTLALAAGYVALMVAFVRPAVGWFARRQEARDEISQGTMAMVFLALLLSALATEAIGIHALFGAFLLGALVPHDSALARRVRGRLEDVVIVLLLPAFFAFVGLRTEIGVVRGIGDWALCGLIVVVASLGKFGGSAVAARLTGAPWREAAALGALMNTRGLMELVVLNIGLDLGVLSPRLFAMLVIMALVTTLATTPAVTLITRGAGAAVDGRA